MVNLRAMGLAAAVVITMAAGCKKDKDKPAGGEGPAAAKTTAPAAPTIDLKNWEAIKAAQDTAFEGVNTADRGQVTTAIIAFKAVVGAPQAVEGRKEFWYAKNTAGTCMGAWVLDGAGYGSQGVDASKCGS